MDKRKILHVKAKIDIYMTNYYLQDFVCTKI